MHMDVAGVGIAVALMLSSSAAAGTLGLSDLPLFLRRRAAQPHHGHR